MKKVYIGIDAHKATNHLAYAVEGREAPDLIGRVSTDLNRTVDAIRRFITKTQEPNRFNRTSPAGARTGAAEAGP